MKFWFQKLAILVLLAIFYCLAIPIGFLFTAFAVITLSPHIGEVITALDKFIAATLGWSGRYTVSAQCAVSTTLPARMLRSVLNAIMADHCENAAKSEGLTND